MIDSDHDNKSKVVRLDGQDSPDDLSYCIELWSAADPGSLERIIARAASAGLARAIFKAAGNEHPGRRITLRHGRRIIADSAG
jgi:hypothetical protein